jgi:hypothetical protein
MTKLLLQLTLILLHPVQLQGLFRLRFAFKDNKAAIICYVHVLYPRKEVNSLFVAGESCHSPSELSENLYQQPTAAAPCATQ